MGRGSVWAVTMVRDEADVIEGMVRHTLGEVDRMIVADNASTDRTGEILQGLVDEGLPLSVVFDPEVAYYQSDKMTALADKAYAEGAEWIVPVDADELWHGPHRIGDMLESADPDHTVAWATLHNHLCTADDVADPDPFRAMVWRSRGPGALPKVAVRWEPGCVIEQGNHGAKHPRGVTGVPSLAICHFPARSAAQFTNKAMNGARAYAATEGLPEDMGAHWRSYGHLVEAHGVQVLGEIFREHWWYLSPIDSGLIMEHAPYRRWEQ